jgi:hypothetical protein
VNSKCAFGGWCVDLPHFIGVFTCTWFSVCFLACQALAQTPGTLKWVYRVNGEIRSSPSVAADGTVYVAAATETQLLYSLSPSGTLNWTFGYSQFPYKGFSSPIILPTGSIVTACDDGYIYQLNTAGDIIWRFNTGLASQSGVAFDHLRGRIFVSIPDGRLVCLNTSGGTIWTFDAGTILDKGPVIGADGTVYVTTRNRLSLPSATLLAVSSAGGKLWEFLAQGNYEISAPSLGGQGIYFGGNNIHRVYALSYSGSLKWEFATKGRVRTPPAVGLNDQLFFGTEVWSPGIISPNRQISCVSSSGKLSWSKSFTQPFTTTPTITADGSTYWTSWSDTIHSYDTKGKLRWSYSSQTGVGFVHSSPSVGADGTIVAGDIRGYVYALHGSSALASVPWPTDRGNSWHTGARFSPAAAPANVKAIIQPGGLVSLSWTHSSTPLDSLQVWRSGKLKTGVVQASQLIQRLAPGTLSFADNLPPGSFSYQIVAVSPGGSSASKAVKVKIP